jgi:hypothetical protein
LGRAKFDTSGREHFGFQDGSLRLESVGWVFPPGRHRIPGWPRRCEAVGFAATLTPTNADRNETQVTDMGGATPLDGNDKSPGTWSPTSGWASTDRNRRQAVRTTLRKHPWLWLSARLGRRPQGLSLRHEPPTSAAEILNRVVSMPVSLWTYGWEDESVRHLGPMAQDFAAAFGLGDRDDEVNMVDSAGVLFVCVQALHRRVVELEARLDTLEAADPP